MDSHDHICGWTDLLLDLCSREFHNMKSQKFHKIIFETIVSSVLFEQWFDYFHLFKISSKKWLSNDMTSWISFFWNIERHFDEYLQFVSWVTVTYKKSRLDTHQIDLLWKCYAQHTNQIIKIVDGIQDSCLNDLNSIQSMRWKMIQIHWIYLDHILVSHDFLYNFRSLWLHQLKSLKLDKGVLDGQRFLVEYSSRVMIRTLSCLMIIIRSYGRYTSRTVRFLMMMKIGFVTLLKRHPVTFWTYCWFWILEANHLLARNRNEKHILLYLWPVGLNEIGHEDLSIIIPEIVRSPFSDFWSNWLTFR